MLEDKTFLDILEIIRKKSTCSFFKTGALVVKENRIVSMGYNGTPSGFPQCNELQEVLEYVREQRESLSVRFGGNAREMIPILKDKFSYFKRYSSDFLKFFEEKLVESLEGILNLQDEPDLYKLNFLHSRYEIHAEQNAIAFSLKAGTNIAGSTLYTSLLPCMECAKLIVASGIKRVVFVDEYEDKRFKESSVNFLKINGILVEKGG